MKIIYYILLSTGIFLTGCESEESLNHDSDYVKSPGGNDEDNISNEGPNIEFVPTDGDSDGDTIPDYVDAFPNNPLEYSDSNANGLGDNTDTTDHLVTVPTPELREHVQLLWQRWVNYHLGLGEFILPTDSTMYSNYLSSIRDRNNLASNSLAKFEAMNLESNPLLSTTAGVSLAEVSEALYSLGIAHQLGYGDKYEQYAIELIDWFVENSKTLEQTEQIATETFYLGTLGNAFILLRDLLEESGRLNSVLEFLWGEHRVFTRLGTMDMRTLMFHDLTSSLRSNLISYDADFMRASVARVIASVLLLPHETDVQLSVKVSHLVHLQHFLITFSDAAPGIKPFFKADFSAYHHYVNYTSGYSTQAVSALSRLVFLLNDSPWSLKKEELYYIEGYARNVFFWAHLDHIPSGLIGRLISQNSVEEAAFAILPHLILTLEEPSQELKQLYCNYVDLETKISYKPTYRLYHNGFIGEYKVYQDAFNLACEDLFYFKAIEDIRIYPYSALASVRQDNWALYVQSIDRWNWTYEGGIGATNPQNVYGLYNRYGTMQLYYFTENNRTRNPLFRNNGFDWSHYPGSTAPYRSLDEMLEDNVLSRYRIDSAKSGGTTINYNDGESAGLYVSDLRNFDSNMRDVNFTARKSYFFLGERIVALGAGISNKPTHITHSGTRAPDAPTGGYNRDYEVHTTIFQNYIRDQENPEWMPTLVDGIELTSMNYKRVVDNSEQLLVVNDSEGTGYIIKPQGGEVYIERRNIDSRDQGNVNGVRPGLGNDIITSASRELLYLNHGYSPENHEYEYVILPKSTKEQTEYFAGRIEDEYAVIQKDSLAHIIHDKRNNIWAYALFGEQLTNAGPLIQVDVEDASLNEDVVFNSETGGTIAIIIKQNAHSLSLSVAYTDLRLFNEPFNGSYSFGQTENSTSKPVAVTIELKGHWQLDFDKEDVESDFRNDKTHIKLQLANGKHNQIELFTSDSTSSEG